MIKAPPLSIHSPVHVLLEDHLSPEGRGVLRGAAHALDLLDEAATITLPDRRFVYVNAAFEQIYGFSCASMLGRANVPIHTRAVPDQLVEAIFTGTAQGGWSGMLENQSRTGKRFEIQLRTRPITTASGEVVGYLGISHPSTWQKVSFHEPPPVDTAVTKGFDPCPLSAREREVLSCYGLGLNTKETASQLRISIPSVFTYRARIIQKLSLKSPADFYVTARQYRAAAESTLAGCFGTEHSAGRSFASRSIIGETPLGSLGAQ